MCDALAVALMRKRGLTREQFAIFHPGGNLGRKLLLTVGQLMRRGESIPVVTPETRLREAIVTISKGSIGAVFATNGEGRLQGLLTDGDLRRIFQSTPNPLDMPLSQLMIKQPHTIAADALAAKALRLMEDRAITVLPVVDEQGRVTGAIHLHDLLQAQLA
jgi:arabinose-5-phosphate isomerase